jgi:hypothetical protein
MLDVVFTKQQKFVNLADLKRQIKIVCNIIKEVYDNSTNKNFEKVLITLVKNLLE